MPQISTALHRLQLSGTRSWLLIRSWASVDTTRCWLKEQNPASAGFCMALARCNMWQLHPLCSAEPVSKVGCFMPRQQSHAGVIL